jgi:hypothetical protein
MALREVVMKRIVGSPIFFITVGINFIVDSLFVVQGDRKTIIDVMSSTLVVQR